MKLLLDTCTFLWYVMASDKLSSAAKEAIDSPGNTLYLSVVSGWEIAVKYANGQLDLPEPPETFVPTRRQAAQIGSLNLYEAAVLRAAALPRHHGDPFDRMLTCQAIESGLLILSPDRALTKYSISVLW